LQRAWHTLSTYSCLLSSAKWSLRKKKSNHHEHGSKHVVSKEDTKEILVRSCKLDCSCFEQKSNIVVKSKTPEEAWSGIKLSVHHFRVFGCITYAHVTDCKRSKLDDKSVKCVLLGISKESKAYCLYDPIS
jgi:hypothetical protein